MDDTSATENPAPDFNKIDLTQLQGFSFGTQWTQDKADPSGKERSRERREGPPREGGDPRRDRRGFRKPAITLAPDEASDRGGATALPEQTPSDRVFRRERDFRGGGARRDTRDPVTGERPHGPRQYPRARQEQSQLDRKSVV